MQVSWEQTGKGLDWFIRGHFVVQLLIGLGIGKLMQSVITKHAQISPPLATAIWLLTAAAVLLLLMTIFKQRVITQQQASRVQIIPTATLPSGTSAVNIQGALATSYNSVLQVEVETNFATAISAYPPNEREPTLIKVIASGLISYLYDKTWWSIYRSQLLALQKLNSTALSRQQVKAHYDAAASLHPERYAAYSFEQWLAYMRSQVLILDLPGGAIGITVRGKDFLKYMVHCGYSVDERVCKLTLMLCG